MTKINVSEAVRRGFGSRHILHRAINEGRLEATKQENGQIFLDLAQLRRVLGRADTEHRNLPSKAVAKRFSKNEPSSSTKEHGKQIDLTTKHEQSCLLVLGMHRSGTSALTRCLSLLGASLPKNLMPANDFNEPGYWESMDLCVIHDSLLQSNGSHWSDWAEFDHSWYGSSDYRKHKRLIKNFIQDNFANVPLFIVKDPRICRFLPLWRSVLDELEISFYPIVPLRNPLEVSKSLNVRDGFGAARSCLIWLRHVLEAEYETRGVRRAITRFENMLSDASDTTSRISNRLGVSWPHPLVDFSSDIESFIDDKYRHSSFALADLHAQPEVGKWIITAYDALCVLADEGENEEAYEICDAIRAQLNDIGPVFADVISEAERSVRVPFARELDAAKMIADDRALDIERLGRELTGRNAQIEKLKLHSGKLSLEVVRIGDELTGRDVRITELETASDELTLESKRLVGELAERDANAADLKVAIDTLSSEVERLSKKLAGRDAQIAQLHAAAGDLAANLEQMSSELWLRSQDNRHLKTALATVENSLFWRMLRPFRSYYSTSLKSLAWDSFSALFLGIASVRGKTAIHRFLIHKLQQRLIEKSGLFDPVWYLETNSDVNDARVDPIVHYIKSGAAGRRDPHPLFDASWYYEKYPCSRETGLNPLVHYICCGAAQGYDPNPLFDSNWYTSNNPDVLRAGLNPLLHYIEYGAAEGRDPNPHFDSNWYVRTNLDVSRTGMNPLAHYLTIGAKAGCNPNRLKEHQALS